MPTVSIIIATRNRAQKLDRLLCCIQQQQFADFECIVVDDASSTDTLTQYEVIWQKLDSRFVLHRREYSGGPAQSRNTGIMAANSEYIAFCDDDDYWTRTDHLAVAVRTLRGENADFFFGNMQTSINEEIRDANWFKVLTRIIDKPIDGEVDVYSLTKKQLAIFLKHRIHHANTMVVARDLLIKIDCYWEKVIFAEDHDLSFRLSDAAKRVLFRTTVTADLDVSTHPSVARTFSEQDRTLFGMLSTIHAEVNIISPLLRKVVRGNRAWRLIELAQYCEKDGRISASYELVWQSFVLSPSLTAFKILLKLFWRRMLNKTADMSNGSSQIQRTRKEIN
jgi:glycosyltransferase involved in cell wall biosynthesis